MQNYSIKSALFRILMLIIICMDILEPMCVMAREGEAGEREEEQNIEEDIDINALSKELHLLEQGYSYPDFQVLFGMIRSLQWKNAGRTLLEWLVNTLGYEMHSTGLLYREIICIVLFTSIFSTLSSAFPDSSAKESGFTISWMILFMILFTNFRIMSNLFCETIEHLSGLLKILIPVYTTAVTVSGNLTTGAAFYEYFMLLILFLNWFMIRILMPGIKYYFILELFQNFSPQQHMSRLCHTLFLLLSKGIKVIFFLFFGAHVLESMLIPSFDLAKTGLFGRLAGMIPGAGSVVQTVAGTVIASSMVIKNALGVSVILFLITVLAVPVFKMLVYILFNVVLSVLLEPVSDHRFIECISTAGKCGTLMLYGLGMTIALLVLVIAVTTMATNQIM